jgi:C4-dicarboxylate transporter DctQ subunit
MSATRADASAVATVRRLLRVWDRGERIVVGVLGLAALALGLWQVLGRYFYPREAISYAEEVIVYLIIWAVMLISSELVRTDGHVRSDLVLRLLPVGTVRWIEVFNCIVASIFCAGLVWYGYQIVDTAVQLDERSSTDLQFPMWIYYTSLPVGAGLMLVRYLVRLVRYVVSFDPADGVAGFAAHEMSLDASSDIVD